MLVMVKKKGFTLIELLVAITLLAFLATWAAPDFFKTQRKTQLRTNTQGFIDIIGEARSNAIANKRCDNGGTPEDSLKWSVVFQPGNNQINLYCQWAENATGHAIQDTSDTYDLSDYILLEEVSSEDQISYVVLHTDTAPTPALFAISFFSGSVQSKLENLGTGITTLAGPRVSDIRLVFQFTEEPSSKRVICMDGVAGFPRMDNGNTCLAK